MKEAVDSYKPDIVWFDCGFGGSLRAEHLGFYRNGKLTEQEEIFVSGYRSKYQREFLAHYFNLGERSKKEVELVYKTHDIPPGIGMWNMENGNIDGLSHQPWMSDVNMIDKGEDPEDYDWFYKEGAILKGADYLIPLLIDIVSKNGRMLLNVPPRADGSFPKEAVKTLEEIGSWLEVNKEAIYDTIPWIIYGEGPTEIKEGHYSDEGSGSLFDVKDVRFTVKGNNIYAIVLGWPGEQLRIRSMGSRGKLYEGEIKAVELLGHSGGLNFKQEPYFLTIDLPANKPCNYAYAFKCIVD